MALALGAILALVLSASASAAPPFPEIKRAHELSCSGAKAKLAITVSWQKANRKGKHRGHAVALIRGKSGRIHHRKVKSTGLRRVRSQSIEYRFRFPKRASRRLCKGKARVEVVASHGQNKDRQGVVEIYRVARKTLGGKASASGEVGAAGPNTPGSDCRPGTGGTNTAIIKPSAQLQNCDLTGAFLPGALLIGADLIGAFLIGAVLIDAFLVGAVLEDTDLANVILIDANLIGADLDGADLFHADLTDAILIDARLELATLTGANLTDANLTDADLSSAILNGANFSDANLTGANLFGANLDAANQETLVTANCSGATKPDGSTYPTGTGDPPFFQC